MTGGQPMDGKRVRVVQRLERELPPIVESVIGSLRLAVPAYRDLQGPQLADVEAIAYWSLRTLLGLWSTSAVGVAEHDRSRFRAVGAARAADGRPLADVLRAYRVVAAEFIKHVADNHLEQLDPVDVAELGIVVLTGVDWISEEIIDGHTAARERLVSSVDQSRAALLDDVIVGRQSSPGAVADRARQLGVELPDNPHLLVVAAGDSTAATIAERFIADMSGDTIGSGDVASVDHLVSRRSDRVTALLPQRLSPADLDSTCRSLGSRGCVITGPLADVGTAYRLATDALDTAPDHAFDGRWVLDRGDAALLALLTARPWADTASVMSAVLGPLTDRAHEHILEGLAAFIVTGTATEAASRLRLHPQTLRYRLRRARELTGRDPRSAWHRLALDTAIALRQLHRPR